MIAWKLLSTQTFLEAAKQIGIVGDSSWNYKENVAAVPKLTDGLHCSCCSMTPWILLAKPNENLEKAKLSFTVLCLVLAQIPCCSEMFSIITLLSIKKSTLTVMGALPISPLLVRRDFATRGRSISVLSEQYETSYLFYVTLSFLRNIICYLISVFVFSLVTLSGATTLTESTISGLLAIMGQSPSRILFQSSLYNLAHYVFD